MSSTRTVTEEPPAKRAKLSPESSEPATSSQKIVIAGGAEDAQKKKVDAFIEKYASHPHYQSPHGNTLNARSWQTEAPLRMLLNNLDGEVAEDPSSLVVYGGTGGCEQHFNSLTILFNFSIKYQAHHELSINIAGQAARDVPSVKKIIEILLTMDNEHSLLV